MASGTANSKVSHFIPPFIFNPTKAGAEIEEAAKLVKLTKSSFCKFLKSKTKKTFSTIVNEVRISKAAESLQNSEKTISEICYECGFNDPSYFFRQFSKFVKMSPKKFRESYS